MNNEFVDFVRVGDLLIRGSGLAVVMETTIPWYVRASIPVMYYWEPEYGYRPHLTYLAGDFPLRKDVVR